MIGPRRAAFPSPDKLGEGILPDKNFVTKRIKWLEQAQNKCRTFLLFPYFSECHTPFCQVFSMRLRHVYQT